MASAPYNVQDALRLHPDADRLRRNLPAGIASLAPLPGEIDIGLPALTLPNEPGASLRHVSDAQALPVDDLLREKLT